MLRMLEREHQDVLVMPNHALEPGFAEFATKMQQAQLPELIVNVFHHYYEQLVRGATGYIYQEEAQPVATLPDITTLAQVCLNVGQAVLDRTVVLKLNGGLGTSMGMEGPKSLLPAKNRASFLDIIVEQVQQLRHTTSARLPLMLMDSFTTQKETLAALAQHSDFTQNIPFDFLQHKVPKVRKLDFSSARWPADPDKEWCPPGHGDLYAALVTSGMLQALLDAGYEYAFVSNSDNLGATLDLRILGYFALNELPFLMEVAERTPADRKGGHLAQRPDGQLILRELAQCPPEEQNLFQDITRYKYFNTNNLWVHLPTLRQVLDEREGVLGLPLIRNEKPVDPTDPQSYRIYQLETAMGSAIAVFQGAQALRVTRERFIPVKKNSDLLLLWSDVYVLTDEYHLSLNLNRRDLQPTPPLIELDDRYYQMIDDMRARFPYGAPSLLECTALYVEGNVFFGKDVVLKGKVHIVNEDEEPLWIEDGAVLQGE
ncbi:UTP--glucose-1-phosphate uridylyltransferase [soil metagenome]